MALYKVYASCTALYHTYIEAKSKTEAMDIASCYSIEDWDFDGDEDFELDYAEETEED